jgi:hypothetical protein
MSQRVRKAARKKAALRHFPSLVQRHCSGASLVPYYVPDLHSDEDSSGLVKRITGSSEKWMGRETKL